jgi:NADH dehydrogenase [ubiquinone] 1 alpha subcomplex assembly factor 1
LKCAAIAWNLKDLIPATECDLFKFATAADLIQWEVYSDAENGGMTTASFQSNGDLGTGVFAGNLSVELMEHANTRMRRSGFSGIRTVQDLNLEDFNTIAMRVKGDGRCYVSTVTQDAFFLFSEEESILSSVCFVLFSSILALVQWNIN